LDSEVFCGTPALAGAMTIRPFLRRVDWVLFGSALLLSLLGLVLLATAGGDVQAHGLALKQGIVFVVAALLVLLLGTLHYSVFRSLASPFYLAVLVLIALTLLQSHRIRGITAWLVLGGLQLQPSELIRVALVLVLARLVSGNRSPILSGSRLAAAGAIIAIPSLLILRQPDLGSAALLVITAFGMLAVAGLSRSQKVLLILGGLVLVIVSWQVVLAPYQKERLLVFLHPARDPLGTGYTSIQARTAFGSGGLTGRGLGWGPQSRLNFLPEAHTDFVFARLGEELGLVGVGVTLGLFAALFSRLLKAVRRTSDAFGRALVVGSFCSILAGLAMNAGMNIGLFPVVGVPLPLISYGGSSLLASYVLLGLSLSVAIHGERWEHVPEESALVEAHA